MDDWNLLQDYAAHGSENAFRALVHQHLPLVHGAAMRRVNNWALAQEIAQAVFVLLARKAATLPRATVLAGWLYQTTRYVATRAIRSEVRRQQREEEAAAMHAITQPDETWQRIAPTLDEGLERLSAAERDAVLLRFLGDKSLQQVGLELGISEDAAKKRVGRALEKLRHFFGARGFAVSVTVLATTLSAHGAPSVASTLEFAVGSSGLAASGAASALPQLAREVLAAWKIAKLKLIASLSGTAVVLTVTVGTVLHQNQTKPPDPRALLQTVARARARLASGRMELQSRSFDYRRPKYGTNVARLNVLFDRERQRFEQFSSERIYTLVGRLAGEVSEAKTRELESDWEALVRLGLGYSVDARSVTFHVGDTVTRFDERNGSVTLDDAGKSAGGYLFDPRVLGLYAPYEPVLSLSNMLGGPDAKVVALAGQASVEGRAAWHVKVQIHSDFAMQYWIDSERPERVLQCVAGPWGAGYSRQITSWYDGANPKDPLPLETRVVELRGDVPLSEVRVTRGATAYGGQIAPSTWTLAGFVLPPGTTVTDLRTHRSLGYWTGSGLEPSPSKPYPPRPPDPRPGGSKLLPLVASEPASALGLATAMHLLTHQPDTPGIEQAFEAIRRHHITNAALAELCPRLIGWTDPHPAAPGLLRDLIAKNQNREVQAFASFALASLLQREAMQGTNLALVEAAALEAQPIWERIAAVHPEKVDPTSGAKFAERAEEALRDLPHRVGQIAPEIWGADSNGEELRLSDYRGRAVLVVFSNRTSAGSLGLSAPLRELHQRWPTNRLEIFGVMADPSPRDLRRAITRGEIAWPCTWEGPDGANAHAWNVRTWPAVHLLDAQGIILRRDLRPEAIAPAVAALLGEKP